MLKGTQACFLYLDVAFADTLFGWVATDNHAVFGQTQGHLLRTTNGGAVWDTVDQGVDAFTEVRFGGPDVAWRSWHSHPPNSQDQYGIQTTTNRGANWINIFSRPGPFALVDSLKGWVISRDTLFNTRDAGATWSWQIPPGSYLYDLFFSDSLNGWIVGGNGLILHTTDGGSGVWEEPSRLTLYSSPLTVFPNPFTSFATVPGHSSERFALYDVTGRKVGVYQGDRIGEGLLPGVYFLREAGGGSSPVRIVKVR